MISSSRPRSRIAPPSPFFLTLSPEHPHPIRPGASPPTSASTSSSRSTPPIPPPPLLAAASSSPQPSRRASRTPLLLAEEASLAPRRKHHFPGSVAAPQPPDDPFWDLAVAAGDDVLRRALEVCRAVAAEALVAALSGGEAGGLTYVKNLTARMGAFVDRVRGPSQVPCGSSGQSGRAGKKRKEQHSEDEDEGEENDAQENDEASASKKPRVVWSIELHRKFVAAVNQLGIDKAVPKRILELMNVEKLTRENVASHLQKYRLYLKRLSAVASQQASIAATFGGRDPFLHMGAFEGLHSYQSVCYFQQLRG